MRLLTRLLLRAVLIAACLLPLALGVGWWCSERRLNARHAHVAPRPAPWPALVAEGRHLVRTRGCLDCHGPSLEGRVVADKPPVIRLIAPNLTRLATSPADLHARVFGALHHGVDADGESLLAMPRVYSTLSAREVEAIAAYLATLPASGHVQPDSRVGVVGRALLLAGKLDDLLTAEGIDHDAPLVAEPPPVDTFAYGRHAAALCTGCHGRDFGGAPPHAGDASAPAAPDLTDPARIGTWREGDFVTAMRTGVRPDGSRLDARYMPWPSIGRSTDAELHAMWRYLRSLPRATSTTPSPSLAPEHP